MIFIVIKVSFLPRALDILRLGVELVVAGSRLLAAPEHLEHRLPIRWEGAAAVTLVGLARPAAVLGNLATAAVGVAVVNLDPPVADGSAAVVVQRDVDRQVIILGRLRRRNENVAALDGEVRVIGLPFGGEYPQVGGAPDHQFVGPSPSRFAMRILP